MKCVKCKREATAKHNGYGWMCTFHYNKLIRELRIKRKLNKKNYNIGLSGFFGLGL